MRYRDASRDSPEIVRREERGGRRWYCARSKAIPMEHGLTAAEVVKVMLTLLQADFEHLRSLAHVRVPPLELIVVPCS